MNQEKLKRLEPNKLPVINWRKVRMMSSHHAPYALRDARATMAGTKDRDPARVS